MEKNMNSWECDKLFASEASGPQKNLKMGLGGNLKFCGYGPVPSRKIYVFKIQQTCWSDNQIKYRTLSSLNFHIHRTLARLKLQICILS